MAKWLPVNSDGVRLFKLKLCLHMLNNLEIFQSISQNTKLNDALASVTVAHFRMF